ncbi:hypothetical protein Tco_0910592 [Tanacetum coccineum]|uniref:Reverse transcriptase Ty1/copia-type domain-containing protein n=1 Tax=Tanacetum coccineum TaxID=301880 RepID=A0ABQ5CVZ4_9ASTR
MVPFIKELGYTGKCDMLSEIHTDHMHQPWRTFATVINRCISGKSTCLDRLRPSRAQILWGMFYKKNVDFRWSIKSFKILKNIRLDFATGKATPKKARKFKKIASPSKKHTLVLEDKLAKKPKRAKHHEPAKKSTPTKEDDSSKKPSRKHPSSGIELLSDVALLEEAQLKKALNRSKRETTIHQAGGSSEGTDSESEFLMSQKGDSGDEANEQGNDEVDKQSDDDHEQADDERTESNDEEEETQDDEYIHTLDDYVPTDDETNDKSDDVTEEEYGRINEELYGDINVSLTDVEPANKEKDDKEMIVAGHMNVNQEGAGNQVKDDAQATRKTEGPIPSSSISSDYAAKYLNFDNIPPVDTKVVSMLDINVQHEVPRTSPFLTIPSLLFPHLQQLTLIPTPTTTEATTSTTAISESETLVALQLRITNLEKDIKELKTIDHSTSLLSTIKSKVLIASRVPGTSLDVALYKSTQAEETVFESGDTQEPQNQGRDMGNTNDQPNVKAALKHDWFKKPERPLTPDSDWNVRKSVDFRPPQTWISNIAQAKKPPLSFDELMSTPIDFSAYVMNHLKIDNLTQEHLVGPAFNLLKGTCKSFVELEYNIKECYKAVTDRLNWNNPEGKEYPFDLSKPLPLIMERVVKLFLLTTSSTMISMSGIPSTGSQKLPQEAQYHQAKDIQVKKREKGKILTKIELTLEQSQQGVIDEVLAEIGSIHMLSEISKLLSGIEDSHHGPSHAMHNPPQPLKILHVFYKMDVKTAFLNGELREEQSLCAWYDMLSKFLLSQEFSKGVIDPTLFTRKEGKDIILKYDMESSDSVDTPMVGRTKLDEDLQGTPVDPTCYHGKAYRKALTCSKMGLSIPERNSEYGSLHSRSKHIDVRYHLISKKVENGVVELDFVRTEYQLTVIFTKALAREIFEFLINQLGMKSMPQETLKSLAEENEKIMDQEDLQQAALDEALVPIVDQVKIGSCNMRIDPTKIQKEATYQLTLDILKLALCYNAFLITTNVAQIYMQQF